MIVNRLDQLISGGLLAAIAFTALAHGAVEPWSMAIFELLVLFLLLLWVIKSVRGKRFEMKVPITAYPVAAFLVYGLIQSIVLTGDQGRLSSLSLDPESTGTAATGIFFLLAAHLIAANFFNSNEKLKLLVNSLAIFGFALALLGILQLIAGNGKIYWVTSLHLESAWAVGPFVNRNHFAGYLELIIPIPVALIITGVLKPYRFLYGFGAILMAVALVLSGSRGGIISMTASLFFTFIASVNYAKRSTNPTKHSWNDAAAPSAGRQPKEQSSYWFSSLAVIVVIIAAIFVGAAWIGLDPVTSRFTDNSLTSTDEKAGAFEDSRGPIWRTSTNMIRANPIFGVGLGAFETAYPKYSENNESLVVNWAHNDYLQVLTDSGIIGGIFALGFLLTFIYNTARVLRCSDPLKGAIAIGTSGAVFSLLIHSIFDFNLQIPSNALLFLVLNAVLSEIAVTAAEPGGQV